MDHAYISFLLL
jgi:endonuclease I